MWGSLARGAGSQPHSHANFCKGLRHSQAGGQDYLWSLWAASSQPALRVPETPGGYGCGPGLREGPTEAEEGSRGLQRQPWPGPSWLLDGGLWLHSAPRRPPAPLTDSIASPSQFLDLESSLAADPAPHPVPPRNFRLRHSTSPSGRKAGNPPFRQWLRLA